MQTASCIIVCLFALYEQSHPGARLIPGWISFQATLGGHGSGVRVGSTFLDYELFGEYCALNLFLQMFQWTRVTSNSRRWFLAGTMLLTFFCLFATVTRGAILAFIVGAAYLIWLSRRRLNFVRLVTVVSLGSGLILGADFIVANYTNSDSVLERLFTTQLENGVPDTRAGAWKQSFSNILKKPLIGHGPYMAPRIGVEVQYWPHNVYLYYAYIVGFIGLAFYLWILWRLWQASRPRAGSLGDGPFIAGATVLARVMLFTFLIDQTKIDYLRNPRYSFFIWMLFGLVWAIGRVAREELVPARRTAEVPAASQALPPGLGTRGSRTVAARPAIQRVAASPAVPRS
jgi:O-antigen ligase